MTADIIIPTYRPGREFKRCMKMLQKQSIQPDHIFIMNTEEKYWDASLEKQYPLSVTHISKAEFDHGGTRQAAALKSKAEIVIFMTQDALPKDEHLIQELMAPFEDEETAAVYARQLPNAQCSELEKYTRSFNYPGVSKKKTLADLKKLGIKTYFCSNVCAAYRKDIFEALGGFDTNMIFNEDMVYAAKAIQAKKAIVYAANAKVVHSHNYSGITQFHRNFDMGVSQKQHPEVFEGIHSESEGIKLVKKAALHCLNIKKPWLIIPLCYQSGCKLLGYRLGYHYERLPKSMVIHCSLNKAYWT